MKFMSYKQAKYIDELRALGHGIQSTITKK